MAGTRELLSPWTREDNPCVKQILAMNPQILSSSTPAMLAMSRNRHPDPPPVRPPGPPSRRHFSMLVMPLLNPREP